MLLAGGGCAVDSGDPEGEEVGDGGDPECTGDKCDDLDGEGRRAKRFANTCAVDLEVGVVEAGAYEPDLTVPIPRGGAAWFPTLKGDRFVIPDVGRAGWRTVAYADGPGPIELDRGWCPWDVFIESGTVTEKAADGRDWDPYLAGGYARPDPYATAYADGQKINCQGHPSLEGSPTSTASDTTTPEWNRETLSWVAWHDISDAVELVVVDDDLGPGGELIGSCRIEDIPAPEWLPAVITSDCGGGGSMTIRIEPADADPVATGKLVILGSCS